MRRIIFIPGVLLIAACGRAVSPSNHSVQVYDLSSQDGQRVQVSAEKPISREQCETLIDLYRDEAEPDGRISVHAPSERLDGELELFCVENLNGAGVEFTDVEPGA